MPYATIRDVAERAGLSIAAVSQSLNGKGRISLSTREKVLKIAEELNYVPDSGARAMRTSHTGTIGLLVPDIRNAYFADLAYRIQDALFQAGYSTLIVTASEQVNRQDALLKNLLAQRIDGVIVIPQGKGSRTLHAMADRGTPLIFVDRNAEGMSRVPLIDSDPFPGMQEALHELASLGHRRVGFISGPLRKSPTLAEREFVFRRIAADLFEADNIVVASTHGDRSSCEKALRTVMDRSCTAVIFGYSPDTVQAIDILRERKLRPGHDLSIISFDDIKLFELLTPSLSVISQQLDKMGLIAAQGILDLIPQQSNSNDNNASTGTDADADAKSVDTVVHSSTRLHTRIPTVFIRRDSVRTV